MNLWTILHVQTIVKQTHLKRFFAAAVFKLYIFNFLCVAVCCVPWNGRAHTINAQMKHLAFGAAEKKESATSSQKAMLFNICIKVHINSHAESAFHSIGMQRRWLRSVQYKGKKIAEQRLYIAFSRRFCCCCCCCLQLLRSLKIAIDILSSNGQ